MLREYSIAVRNLLLGGNLKMIGLSPRKAVDYVNESLFLERAMNPNGDIPQRAIWDVFNVSSDISVTIRPDMAKHWWGAVASWQVDLFALMMLTQIVKPKRIFEIGTQTGCSALHFALNAPEAEVFTLDLPPNDHGFLRTNDSDLEQQARRNSFNFGDRIRRLYGDSASFDFDPFRNNIDFFFIDGAHTYEYVRNDTERALFCTKRGGVICWHDYGRCGVNGVSKWLHEFRHGREIQRNPGGSLAYMVRSS